MSCHAESGRGTFAIEKFYFGDFRGGFVFKRPRRRLNHSILNYFTIWNYFTMNVTEASCTQATSFFLFSVGIFIVLFILGKLLSSIHLTQECFHARHRSIPSCAQPCFLSFPNTFESDWNVVRKLAVNSTFYPPSLCLRELIV